MDSTWNPDTYLAFADERSRPFVDLVGRIGASAPRLVADLGCGPGTQTALLAQRWPSARVLGVDASAEMIARAQEVPGVEPVLADLVTWVPPAPLDVIVTNAALQWVPGHLEILPSLVARLAPGGWFAMQVPGNFDEPSHAIRRELAQRPEFAEHLDGIAVPSSHDPEVYLRALQDAGLAVDAWETTYLHQLTGEDPVFAWVSGTGARPTLQALPDDVRPAFEAEYRRLLRRAYPPDAEGRVTLPFRRVFAVGRAR